MVQEDVREVSLAVDSEGERLVGKMRRVDRDPATQKGAERPDIVKGQTSPILRELLSRLRIRGEEIGRLCR
jgi:hypothetical protein